MNVGHALLSEGQFEVNTDKQHSPVLITETYHSTIELGQFNGRVAIIKRFRNQDDPRTAPRFYSEVDALRRVASHVSRFLPHKIFFKAC